MLVAAELRELTDGQSVPKQGTTVSPAPGCETGRQVLFATADDCWLYPEDERRREVDLDGWVEQYGVVAAAKH